VNSTKKLAQWYATVKMDPPLSHEVEGEEEDVEEEEVIEEALAEAMVHLEKTAEIVKEVVKNQSFLVENSKRIQNKEGIGVVAVDFVAEVGLEEVEVVIEVEAADVVDSEDSEVDEVSEDNQFNCEKMQPIDDIGLYIIVLLKSELCWFEKSTLYLCKILSR